jgi:ComF family protein
MIVKAKQFLRSLLNLFVDFVYPPLCLSCKQLLEKGGDHVCPECWNSIGVVTNDLSLFIETERKLADSGVVDGLVSLYVFEKEGVFQTIVHHLKYGGVQALGVELGRRLGGAMTERGVHADGIIPIPLHKRKLRERGYNQAERIAAGISEVTGIPMRADIVRRKKYTGTQTMLSLDERHENMLNAFESVARTRNEVKGRIFVVVDDVITTGATIEACAHVLAMNGARKIIAASAALAQKDSGV